MLTPTANFEVNPDQTVRRSAVRFESTLFVTKTSYSKTNIGNPVQAAPSSLIRVHTVCYKTAYGSLCQENATYAYLNRTDKDLGSGSDCS